MIVLTLPFALAQDIAPNRILSNSEDWRDVYSVMQYGVLQGKPTNFLVSSRHATLITNQIPAGENLWVFSSERVPFIVGYESLLAGKGYTAQEFTFENINLELAKRLTGITKFIIVDDSYGYNAISVAPYAALTKSFVLFTDRDNVDDVVDFLDSITLESVLIYGPLDREVTQATQKYNPQTINRNSNRFQNNVEIVKKYREISAAKQVILTNGEFIEQEIMSGTQPVVFIGTNNVPQPIQEYIQGSDIEVGVLIGNELVGTATTIRRQLGISVFVKFAQGARSPRGAISQVEALDMFYLPTYALNLVIDSIKYNRATNQLEVTIKNAEEQAAYFIGTHSLKSAEGTPISPVGDKEAIFIDGNEIKTMVYDVGVLPEGKLTADILVVFGESPQALERELRATLDVDTVRIFDSCDVVVSEISIDVRKGTFHVALENPTDKECYADVELLDIVIAGQRQDVSLESVVMLKPSGKRTVKITAEDFEEDDVVDNEEIKIRVFFGERENNLYKFKDFTLELSEKGGDYLFYTLLVLILLLALLIVWKRRKKKEDKHAK